MPDPVRLDKWLWAARFFKTRSLAAQAIAGGKVEVNGEGVKRARPLKIGDRVRLRVRHDVHDVVVLGLSERRGPASEAARLYEETAESRAARERDAEQRRLGAMAFRDDGGRPTKRDRRELDRLRRRRSR